MFEGPDFDAALREARVPPLTRRAVTTLQLNVGKLCNMACHHCHVEAGPKRREVMRETVAARVLELLRDNPRVELLDLTGGAPEMNPSFRWLVREARALGRRVIDRCNLTVFFEPGMGDLPAFMAEHGVEVVASLPCYTAENVDAQRGKDAFRKSIDALHLLNALGYGEPGSGLELDLVYNPLGETLPPPEAAIEATYRHELRALFGVEFDRLFTITNMPIKRFAHQLDREGQYDAYMGLLVNHFNADNVRGLMCRDLLSVGWDGTLYDCDFNQMLEIGLGAAAPSAGASAGPRTLWDVGSLEALEGAPIATASHCFGCTAGAGSSCSGALR